MYELPLPKAEDIPPGLRGLMASLLKFQEMQRKYSETPLSQHFWPNAKLQYVSQLNPNLFLGGEVLPALKIGAMYNRPDLMAGMAYDSSGLNLDLLYHPPNWDMGFTYNPKDWRAEVSYHRKF